MPKHTFDSKSAENLPEFKLLPPGDYCFEVVSIGNSLSTGAKTRGSDVVELKLAIYADATFSTKLAQWTEDLIFHSSIAWKINQFTKCANMMVDGKSVGDGDEVDYSEETLIGLRGWVTVHTEDGYTDKTKKYSRVKVWLTNKEKLPRNTPAPKVDPFAAKPAEDNPENW